MGNAATAPTTTTKQQHQFGRRAATPLTHTVAASPAIAIATARQQQQQQQQHFTISIQSNAHMPHSNFLHAMEYIGSSPSHAVVPACTFFRYHGRFHAADEANDSVDDMEEIKSRLHALNHGPKVYAMPPRERTQRRGNLSMKFMTEFVDCY